MQGCLSPQITDALISTPCVSCSISALHSARTCMHSIPAAASSAQTQDTVQHVHMYTAEQTAFNAQCLAARWKTWRDCRRTVRMTKKCNAWQQKSNSNCHSRCCNTCSAKPRPLLIAACCAPQQCDFCMLSQMQAALLMATVPACQSALFVRMAVLCAPWHECCLCIRACMNGISRQHWVGADVFPCAVAHKCCTCLPAVLLAARGICVCRYQTWRHGCCSPWCPKMKQIRGTLYSRLPPDSDGAHSAQACLLRLPLNLACCKAGSPAAFGHVSVDV